MIKRGWNKSILVEGKSERGIKILDGESNSFGFFHGYAVCLNLFVFCFVIIHIKRYKLGFFTRQKGFSYVV